MRNAALILILFVASGYAAMSQRFSLLPQVGFENSKTKISYNDAGTFSPIGVKFTPQASLRLSYSSKQGHGFFAGASTSHSIVSLSFIDPETLRNSFSATTGSLQFRVEAGYQFNSKPISLGSSKSNATSTEKRNCSSRCCSHSCSRSKQNVAKSKGVWMRLQPSIGLAYIPGVRSDVNAKTEGGQTVYQYNAGNWRTALIAGAGFELGKGSTRQVTLSINYVKGLGNLDERTITSSSAGKTVATNLESTSSNWNVRIGIPFTLKSSHAYHHLNSKRNPPCQQFRMMYRCHGYN